MSHVAVVTDTISCLPSDLVKQYGIKVVPTVLLINGKSYRDQIEIKADDFWKQFDSMQTFSTSAVMPGDFIKIFQEAGKESSDIVCTLVSKAMSATYQTAVRSREMLKSENPQLNIEIVDSKTAAGAEGFVALEGARAAQAGKGLSEVVRVMQDLTVKVKWVCGLETTKYLIKAGRAPKTIPTEVFLQVKPIIAQIHGTGMVEDAGVARGKEECFQKLVQLVGENTDLTRPLHVNVHYTQNIEDGLKLMEMVKAQYKCEEIYLTPYSPVMGGSVGPCNAISFYS
jgi:DegV family protein with EDD domain